ncbi:MAG: hypothetical protein ABR548_02840 [Actinomycetota bacterium]|nr:hypothetical protein [Actinomycetota bacterium]
MIPNVDDVRSSPLTHRLGDLFNTPGLTNRLGCVQAGHDITAIRSVSFPPFGAGDVSTASLFLNETLFVATGAPVTFTWSPDAIEREAIHDGFRLRSLTAMPVGEQAALLRLDVTNESGVERDLDIRLGLQCGITRKDTAWNEPLPPAELDHDVQIDASTKAVLFRARASEAIAAQAAFPIPDEAGPHALRWRARVLSGATFTVRFVCAYASTDMQAYGLAQRLLRGFDAAVAASRDDWNEELRAIFTPGNDRYGGSLPLLETDDDDVRRAWLSGILGVVYFRRDQSALGRSYDTLMPRYWQTITFLWDFHLSSVVHALLDPRVMRTHLEHWMKIDVHSCLGTDRLTGNPVGPWYSVNDYAMTRMIADYLRWSGDMTWLDTSVDGRTVATHLDEFATNCERFRTPAGLADYGGIANLLECVSTYVHEIAALNAGNVWGMRFAADVASMRRDDGQAMKLRARASELVDAIQHLYAGGYWNARYPDGNLVPVRHCYDFITVLTTIDQDLSEQQRDEMTDFFVRELQTPLWMHALSPKDPDALFSLRPDHQWTGAYPAWPPLAVLGLFRAGKDKIATEWLRGLGRSGNQGPYGQAHFVETFAGPDAGGATKAPSDVPYITDWAVSSGGAWVQAIVEGLFGVSASLDGITATPRLDYFDGRLRNLSYQGRYYDVDASGIKQVR